MLDTGQVIADRYELLKQLGRGGFSEVWLALDKLTDVKVAIKIYANAISDSALLQKRVYIQIPH